MGGSIKILGIFVGLVRIGLEASVELIVVFPPHTHTHTYLCCGSWVFANVSFMERWA